VRPGLTGYLAEAQSAEDLSRGIRNLLEDGELRTKMAHHCREIAEREYANDLQASRYLKLYESMLPVQ
jgi:glycosyltransferase involved in cell wall biosynthesis